jgi:hypothetical protein
VKEVSIIEKFLSQGLESAQKTLGRTEGTDSHLPLEALRPLPPAPQAL